MSFINIWDSDGNEMLLSLKRVDKVKLDDQGEYTVIALEPINKDDSMELIYSTTTVSEIWSKIKAKM